MVFVYYWKFWNYFSFRKTSERKCFARFCLVKKSVLDYKNVYLLMVKKSKFVKGIIAHGFCQKLKILKLFLFELLGVKKGFNDVYFVVNKPL